MILISSADLWGESDGVSVQKVYDVQIQGDGKILLAGELTSFASRAQRGIARLNANGTPDFAFYPIVNGTVWTITLQQGQRYLSN